MVIKLGRNLCQIRRMARASSPVFENIGDMRKTYKDRANLFLEEHLSYKEPIGQFRKWFEEAKEVAGIHETNAMILSTASKDGIPSGRPVLLKSYGTEGFTFFTSYESRKAQDLDENPRAALTFFWGVMQRVIRIEGTVTKVSDDLSRTYFHSRPRESQIGAAASHQSTPVAGRSVLTEKFSALAEEYGKGEIPKPDFWGGYLVKPESIEFWQGQSDRVHDRIKFRRAVPGEVPDGCILHEGDKGWVYERLSP